jgi:hypothetical protein
MDQTSDHTVEIRILTKNSNNALSTLDMNGTYSLEEDNKYLMTRLSK